MSSAEAITSGPVTYSSLEPLNNPLVADKIFAVLPGDELHKARLVNKLWNSAAVRLLKIRWRQFDNSHLGVHSLLEDNTRNQSQDDEWHVDGLKYALEFCLATPHPQLMEELKAGQQLIWSFGSACVQSVRIFNVGFGQAGPDAYRQLQRFLSGTKLERLHLATVGEPETIGDLLIHLVNSPCAVKELSVHINGFTRQRLIAEGGPLLGPLHLHAIHPRITANVESLTIMIRSKDCFDTLAKSMFPKLTRLILNLALDFTDYRHYYYNNIEDFGLHQSTTFVNQWRVFEQFVRRSCPLLTKCTFINWKSEKRHFKKQMNGGHGLGGINLRSSFPNIQFEYY